MSLGSSCSAQVAQLSLPGESADTLEGKLPLWGESADRRDRYEEPSERKKTDSFTELLPLGLFQDSQMFILQLKVSAWEYIISNVILYLMENLIEAQNFF